MEYKPRFQTSDPDNSCASDLHDLDEVGSKAHSRLWRTWAMAHKSGGSSKNNRDLHSKRLGVEALRRRARHPRQHPRAPARHSVAPRHGRGHRQGSYDLRRGRGRGRVQHQRKGRVHVSVRAQDVGNSGGARTGRAEAFDTSAEKLAEGIKYAPIDNCNSWIACADSSSDRGRLRVRSSRRSRACANDALAGGPTNEYDAWSAGAVRAA